MSFGIFASGTGSFTTGSRRNFTDEGDIYALADALSKVAEEGNINLGGQSDNHRRATDAYGNAFAIHLLKTAIGILLINSSRTEVLISAHHNDNWHNDFRDYFKIFDMPWARTRNLVIDGDSINQETRSFIRAMHYCRLNKWGVMLGMARIISEFANHSGINDGPRTMLTLDVMV